MQAKSKLPYPVSAFTGREFVGYEWRNVPEGCEDEARRLASDEGGGILLLQDAEQTKEENAAVPGAKPPKTLDIEPLELDEPVSLAADLDGLTIVELKDIARDSGITGFSTMNKAQLIAALGDD